MNIVLLGSNGFIGKSLSARLQNDHEVLEVSRKTNLSELFASNVTYEYVINCVSSNPNANADTSAESNFDYPMQFIRNLNLKNWIQVDSYFQLQIPMGRHDTYTLEKQRFSDFLDANFGMQGSPSIHHLFLPHVFGEGDRPGRLISSAISAFIRGDIFETSSGTQLLPLLHISDAVNGIIKFLEQPAREASCEPFWYGSVKELLDLISSQFNETRILYGRRPNPVDANYPRIEFPNSVDGWQPKMQLADFLEWVRVQNV